MDWPQFVVQWLHVILAITWFGAALTGDFIFIPAIQKLPLERQREIGAAYGARASRVLNIVAPLVILLGILRGTVFGPIRSLSDLTTPYGFTWLVALVAALATYAWARYRIEPALARMNSIPVEEALLPDGSPSPAMGAAIGTAIRNAQLELIGFVIVFTCMILMRFGY